MDKKESLKWKIAVDHYDERWGHCIEWLQSWSQPDNSKGWWQMGSVWDRSDKALLFATKASAMEVLSLFEKCGYDIDNFWVQGCIVEE